MVGLKLDGATVGEERERGRVGRPVWGAAGLLRDLEMRMGIVAGEGAAALRVQRWATRLAALMATEPFYARSFRVDPVGTAEMLLMWRDGLIEAGWQGTPVPGGGARLDAFATLEAMTEPTMIAGDADRLAAVEVEVAVRERAPYDELSFVDDRRAWPWRWQRIFDLFAERGTRIARVEVPAGDAPAGTDLGRLQVLIAGGSTTLDGGTARGDGSLVLLRAATGIEAADVVAAIAAAGREESVAVVRPDSAALLDEALAGHGVSELGAKPASRWRAALQVLPLAVEAIFEPFDPRRALELLGLAVSPFGRRARYMLSRALSDAPGIGDVRWREAKRRLHELISGAGVEDAARTAADAAGAGDEALRGVQQVHRQHDAARDAAGAVDEAARGRVQIAEGALPAEGGAGAATVDGALRADRELALIEAWLEPQRYDARVGAPMGAIVAAVTRVREWLRRRLVTAGTAVDRVAFAQCEQMLGILGEDARARLDRLAVRQLLDAVGAAGAAAEVSVEQAGRLDHVDHPGALLAARDTIIWWNFVAKTARPPHRARWRRTELEALAACGVVPTEPAALLAEETRQWRMAVLAARRRLVLVLPATDRGERTAPHPLWDEIVARLGLDEQQIARLSISVAELLDAPRPDPRHYEQPDEVTSARAERLYPTTSYAIVNGMLVAVPVPGRRGQARSEGTAAPDVSDDATTALTPSLGLDLETEGLTALALPPARPVWRVAPGLIGPAVRWTVPGLQALIECPLRWVLENAASLRSGSVPALPEGPMLNGALGHRLVAELVASGGLTRAAGDVDAAIDRLLPGVAAWLLQPGMTFELGQLRYQLRKGIEALAALIDRGGLTVAGIEEEVGGDWLGGELAGRLDVRLHDRFGHDLILDLKWGHGAYRDLLGDGRAVQLAFYAQARRLAVGDGRVPPAAYFSLGRGRLLAVDVDAFGGGVEPVEGPGVDDVIARVATTVPRVQQALASGVVPVTGVAASTPLLDAIGVPTADQPSHYQTDLRRRSGRSGPPGCQYCRFGPICGRDWEGLA